MKTIGILSLIILGFSFQSVKASSKTLSYFETENVEAYHYKKGHFNPTLCKFRTTLMENEGEEAIIRVSLASDKETDITFLFDIKLSQLPLSEGKISKYLKYIDGTLTYTYELQRVHGEVERTEIVIDENLTRPVSSLSEIRYTGYSRTGRYIKNQLELRLKCAF